VKPAGREDKNMEGNFFANRLFLLLRRDFVGLFLQENGPRSSAKDLFKYASSACVRASEPVATPAHLRNHIGVFGKGVPGETLLQKGSPRDIRFLKIILPPITELLQ